MNDFDWINYRQLWCAVLTRVLHDICYISCTLEDCLEAERWVGTFPSAQFTRVCDFANHDAEQLHRKLTEICAHPVMRRPAFAGIACSQMRRNLPDLPQRLEERHFHG